MTARHVAVVGGGLAGIAAALAAADRGARVTLIERRKRLGGLTWSFERQGMWVDNGQHVFLRCCDAYQAFTARIGATADLHGPDPLDIPVVAPSPTGTPRMGRLRRQNLPVPLHLASSLIRFPHLPVRDRIRLGRAVVALQRLDLDDPALDQRTFGSWLAQHGQSPAAITAVWDLITVPTVNLPASEASLASAAMVFKTGLLSNPAAADIGWSRVPLGRLHGERAAAALARSGVDVRTGVRVGAVRPVEAGWEVAGEDGVLACDSVIVAVPHEETAHLLSPGAVDGSERWAELGSSAIVDVHLVFDGKVTGWELMAGCDSPVQWVFDRTASSGLGGSGQQYLAVSLSAADHLMGARPEDLISTTVTELGRLLPRVRSTRVMDALVTKERQATFRAAPGSAALRPPARIGPPGLAVAGAWTATGWPATMEGAVRSGWAAAAACFEATNSSPSSRPITQEVA